MQTNTSTEHVEDSQAYVPHDCHAATIFWFAFLHRQSLMTSAVGALAAGGPVYAEIRERAQPLDVADKGTLIPTQKPTLGLKPDPVPCVLYSVVRTQRRTVLIFDFGYVTSVALILGD